MEQRCCDCALREGALNKVHGHLAYEKVHQISFGVSSVDGPVVSQHDGVRVLFC